MKVQFFKHDLNSEYAKSVVDVLDTPFLTSGSVGKSVEEKLCDYFSTKHAGLVNSWTNGTIAALLALDIGKGDEVIIPAMTFIATANVVEIVGAKPVFVDVDPDTLLIDFDQVKKAITSKTKAIIPVHLYGQMVDIKTLKSEINDPNIAIIEDAAHCFEGEFNGEKPGKYSTCAIFSFYATKNVTCGEGGAVISNDSKFFERFLPARIHGMSAGAIDRFKSGGYRHWDMKNLGTKANLPDLLASLLPKQIDDIDRKLEIREAICTKYEQAFIDLPFKLVKNNSSSKSARHLFVIHVMPEIRDKIINVLNENGVNVTVNYHSVPTVTYYKTKYGYDELSFPISYNWGIGAISLPLYPSLKEEEQDHIIKTICNKVVPLIKK